MPQKQWSMKAVGLLLLAVAGWFGVALAPAENEATDPGRLTVPVVQPLRDAAAHRELLEAEVRRTRLESPAGHPTELRVGLRELRVLADGRWQAVVQVQPVLIEQGGYLATRGRVLEGAARGIHADEAIARAFAHLAEGERAPLRVEMRWMAEQPRVRAPEPPAQESVFVFAGPTLRPGHELVLRRMLDIDEDAALDAVRVERTPEQLEQLLREDFVMLQGLGDSWQITREGERVVLSQRGPELVP